MKQSKEEQYKEIFLAEALENLEELDKLFTEMEKDPGKKRIVEAIFRITHTLKGNAQGMGFEQIASLAHTMEDVFSEVRTGKIELSEKLINDLFKANDALSGLVQRIREPERKVSYKGLQAKLNVLLRKAREAEEEEENATPAPDAKSEDGEAVEIAGEVEIEEEEEEESGGSDGIVFSDVIQIPISKLDDLMKLTGELIIERDRVASISEERNAGMTQELSMLHRITSELQYAVMDVRLVQADFLFNKFHRIVRDAAHQEGKKVKLELEGTSQEIDRNVLQTISDSLIHLVRNAIGHGIESEADRFNAGKDPEGTVTLLARSEQDTVIIEVRDDGGGIDPEIIRRKAVEKGMVSQALSQHLTKDEIINFIFEPGFSSADSVTSISGRGVGMDVVKKAIDTIGGKIKVETELGEGTSMTLHLPTTMAVKGALLFEMGKTEIAIPLTYTESVVSFSKSVIHKVAGGLLTTYLGHSIAVVYLADLLALSMEESENIPDGALHQTFDKMDPDEEIKVVIVSHGSRYIGLVVDKLLQQKEIVEKPLERPLDTVKYLSGVTILGNGNVCLVLDVVAITDMLFRVKLSSVAAAQPV